LHLIGNLLHHPQTVTLYAAKYRPDEGVTRYHWPSQTWEHSLAKLGTAGDTNSLDWRGGIR
jgi:hypothetical protein